VVTDQMRQVAPYPETLARLVDALAYKPGWTFTLTDIDRGQGSEGLTLDIVTLTVNSYHPEDTHYRVHHYFIVPAAAYDERSWRRWLLDRLLEVESHECCEFFRFEYHGEFVKRDGERTAVVVERPYAPSHGPGNDPYLIREVGSKLDARTSFRGVVNP